MSKLKTYAKRRDLKRSKEPAAKVGKGKSHIFVIQKHDASRLHYDFRLEIDGVLVSWAVPKGPSTNPADKRLAVRTDDHPMGYAKFEGIIPEGEYGGGTVMVWDYGTYKNIKEKDGKIVPMKQCLKNGQIEVWLKGHKLSGGYALVKTKLGGKGDNWLLVKMRDDEASARRNPVSTH
jgi:DNA ligase D-like protein (predicted 3'-phosphoesterase)